MTYDCVVIGAGLAGLSAALRLAEAGHKVVIVAAGAGSLHLGGSTIDVLGYAPDLVERPAEALAGFAADHPEHPYAALGVSLVDRALSWVRERSAPVVLTGSLERNLLLPTPVGAIKPSALAPESIAAGDLAEGGRVALVSFAALKDFFPALAAANLAHVKLPSGATVECRAFEIEGTVAGEADPGPLRVARLFDDRSWAAQVAARLERRIQPGETVGFPAVLGMHRAPEVRDQLAEALGAPVFEIPTLPPSIPGMRLYRALAGALRRAGGRIIIGPRVVGASTSGHDGAARLDSVTADAGGRQTALAGAEFVLATGGVAAGGITLDSSWHWREAVLGLPVSQTPAPGEERFAASYFDPHPAGRAGLAVDAEWRAVDAGGRPVYRNLRVCGASLAGARPHQEKSGNGLSLATGYAVADAILSS